ncbi:MAG: type I methionyl aminopeptidase [bacterium]
MIVRTEKERQALREGGRLLANILHQVANAAGPGISTFALDAQARAAIAAAGAEPAFLGYHGFPAALCTSINTKVVHGIPSKEEILQEGDILSIDLGIRFRGLFTDMAITVGIGNIPDEAQRLMTATRAALDRAITAARSGATVGDIGSAIQTSIEEQGYNVVRDLVGHGVGRKLHEEPPLPNFGIAGHGTILREGMVLAIEPMVTAGDWHVKTLPDEWSVVTVDGSLAAHFEHTLIVTGSGGEVVTRQEIDTHDCPRH